MKLIDGSLHVLRNKFYLECSGLVIGLFTAFIFSNCANADDDFQIHGNSITTVIDGKTKNCTLDATPGSAVKSFDEAALIVSERGYVPMSKIETCSDGATIHVEQIPEGVGILSDVNISKGLYVALDFVSTQPAMFLATVAKIGSKQNLVSLDGAYIKGAKISDLKKKAFSSTGEAGASTISLDGRYVSADGQNNCGEDSYPGVWDIKENKRVVLNAKKCSDIFATSK